MEGQLKGFMSYSMLPLCIHNCGRSFHYDLQAQEILLPFLVQFFVYFLGLADHPSARKTSYRPPSSFNWGIRTPEFDRGFFPKATPFVAWKGDHAFGRWICV